MKENQQSIPVLAVSDLSVKFRMYTGRTAQHDLEVISNLSICVHTGEVLAVVGSSGSGKSLLAHAILGILPRNAIVSDDMQYSGLPLTPDLQEKLRGREMALVPQSVSFLDPLMRVETQVIGLTGTKEKQRRLFQRYRLEEEVGRLYPHQLSGGMARRILVTTAVIENAKLIVADEPTPGLSPELAKETLQNFRELADQGAAVILITHDIDLAFAIADRIAVFYAGTTVEVAPVSDFQGQGESLRHPYSKAFLVALPQNSFCAIPGFQPYAGDLPPGCLFGPRCQSCTQECLAGTPPMRTIRGGEVRCIHAT